MTVRDSVIRNFTLIGISFQPNKLEQSQLFVSNTLVSDNGGDAINISPAGSELNSVVDHVKWKTIRELGYLLIKQIKP